MSRSARDLPILQATVSLSLALTVLGVFALVGWLSRNDSLLDAIETMRRERWRTSSSIFSNRRGFVSVSDRLFLEVIPSVDHSAGGVYFLGASNQVGAPMVWSLPPEERALVHNYAVLGASHSDQGALVRYLVEHEGLGAAGASGLVVLAMAWPYARPADYFGDVFRYGLYRHSRAEGLAPERITTLERIVRTERARSYHFLVTLRRSLKLGRDLELELRRPDHEPPRAHRPEAYRRAALNYLGPNWRADMDAEVRALGETLDFLLENGLRVATVLSPTASWDRDQPYARHYREQVEAASAARRVPLVDLETLLSDDEYHDYIHPNYEGSVECHRALMEIAREHLARTAKVNG